jgi:LmbE family N-acetylglucosaminyl deacetylase
LRDAGHRVVVATATYGEQGTADPVSLPPERLALIRENELVTSLAVVGVWEHRWLGYRDGECADADGGVASVTQLIADIEPDTILTFGPDGMTGHPDHRAISAWTTAAWRASGGRLSGSAVPCSPYVAVATTTRCPASRRAPISPADR